MKVYVVLGFIDYADSTPMGVYATEGEAERILRELRTEHESDVFDDYWIAAIEVGAEPRVHSYELR